MIIDFRVTVPRAELTLAREEGAGEARPGAAAPRTTYGEVYGRARAPQLTPAGENLIASMSEAGVDKAVLQAEWMAGDYRPMNQAVARMVERYPDRLVGFATVNPAEDDDMAKVVESAVKEMGMKGINLQPWAYGVAANDKRFYPVYSKCQELGVPITIHVSINFSIGRMMDYGQPMHIDEIACNFPELTIVANHGGWPRVTEMVAVAWKHPKVYIEYGAVSPKYIGTPGTGWDPLIVYGNSLLQDRVLFATDSMLPFKRVIEETKALPLKEEVKAKWLGGNAARLLNIAT